MLPPTISTSRRTATLTICHLRKRHPFAVSFHVFVIAPNLFSSDILLSAAGLIFSSIACAVLLVLWNIGGGIIGCGGLTNSGYPLFAPPYVGSAIIDGVGLAVA